MAVQPPFNTRRTNPIFEAGQVLITGRLSAAAVMDRDARLKRHAVKGTSQPYFGAPTGTYVESYRVIESYEIVFRNRRFAAQEMAAHHGGRPAAFSEEVSVDVMSTLNLLGDANRVVKGVKVPDAVLREEIAQQLQIVGISKTSNRDNNESHVTIIVGGVLTKEHDGTRAFEPGDWAIATVASREQVPRDASGFGGKDYAEEQDGGRVTLRLEPYNHSIHMLTPQHVYACLEIWHLDQTHHTARETYLQSYLDASLALQQSILRIATASAVALVNARVLQPAANFDEVAGVHPSLRDPSVSFGMKIAHVLAGDIKENLGGKGLQREVMREVFAAYIEDKQREIWRDRNANNAASGIGEYMIACAYHVRVVLERVLGRVLHGAPPKTDIDLAMFNPSI
jgi:hypothetical protein